MPWVYWRPRPNSRNLQSGARSRKLEEAGSNVSIAKTNLDKAKRDLTRAESLFKAGALSQDNLEQIRNTVDQKEYLLEVAQARQSLLAAGNRPQQIKAAAAELERNKAILQASQSVLEDLQLFAPLTGTVLSKTMR